MLDQAVFTSARTSRGDGYQLVGRSDGVTDAEAKELSAWGPSHDSLVEAGSSAVSYNAFRLAAGRMCVSRTLPAGAEFSQRGGLRIYTQFLLVPEDVFEKFASNAFAILKASLADGFLRVLDQVPASLPAISLTGRASVVDRVAVDRLRSRLGATGLAAVVEVLLGEAPVAVAGALSPYLVYTAAINCLPPECRGEFSFTTGLKYSVRRPLRLFVAPGDASERRQIVRASGCAVLDTAEEKLAAVNVEHGWAAFLKAALAGDRPLDLTMVFSQHRANLTGESLEQLGNELSADLANGNLARGAPLRASGYLRATDSSPDVFNSRVTLSPEALRAAHPLRATRREEQSLRDTATPNGPRESRVAGAQRNESPPRRDSSPKPHSASLAPAALSLGQASVATAVESLEPAVLAKLEEIDDLVFTAIDGDRRALARLGEVWPKAEATVGRDAMEESRQQYVRRAKLVWNEHSQAQSPRPELAAAALEVLHLLFRRS